MEVLLYADAEVTIDVIEGPVSDALSLETEYGPRFVLRQGPSDCLLTGARQENSAGGPFDDVRDRLRSRPWKPFDTTLALAQEGPPQPERFFCTTRELSRDARQ